MNKKICKDCGERKDVDQFSTVVQKRKAKTYGPYYSPYCKACAVIRVNEYRKTHPRKRSVILPMGRPLTEHVRVMLDALADGKWHEVEEIILLGARAVAPGVAFRRGEQLRLRGREESSPRTRGDVSDTVAVGGRFIARQALASHVRMGRCERKETLVRRVR